MGEESIRVYIRGKRARWRKGNIKKLAFKHFPKPSGKDGNVTEMFHKALNDKYDLDPETSLPKEHPPENGPKHKKKPS